MIPNYAHSLGGQKMAIINRQKAINEYYKNPIICKNCTNIISPSKNQKISEIKRKIFCNHTCAAEFNNRNRVIKPKEKKEKKARILVEKFNFLIGKTKQEVFDKHSNWQSARTSIRRFAAYVFHQSGKNKSCFNCGYNKHTEICHIKAVSEFEKEILIEVINHIDNLVALCPNCHWEYDNNILKLRDRAVGSSSLS